MSQSIDLTAELPRRIAAAEEFVAAGDLGAAIAAYADLLAVFPNDEFVLRQLAELYAKSDDIASATYISLRLALVYEQRGELSKAVAVHKRISRLDRTRLKTYEDLARLYEELDLFTEASEQWRALAEHASRLYNYAGAEKYRHRQQELQAKTLSDPAPQRRAADNPVAELAITGVPVVAAPVDMMVFLGHASEDKPAVRHIYNQLREDRFQPWLDEEDLIAGQHWPTEVPKAVRRSHAFVVCLSQRSTTKAGYLQKEIKFALDVLDEQPEGIIFVIPVRLERCQVPSVLQHLHYVDLFEPRGYDRLRRALNARAQQLGLSRGPAT